MKVGVALAEVMKVMPEAQHRAGRPDSSCCSRHCPTLSWQQTTSRQCGLCCSCSVKWRRRRCPGPGTKAQEATLTERTSDIPARNPHRNACKQRAGASVVSHFECLDVGRVPAADVFVEVGTCRVAPEGPAVKRAFLRGSVLLSSISGVHTDLLRSRKRRVTSWSCCSRPTC